MSLFSVMTTRLKDMTSGQITIWLVSVVRY